MPMSRLPRKFLTSWINRSRLVGGQSANWCSSLVDALAAKGISTKFSEWTESAQDRAGWFDLVNSKDN